MSYSTGKIYCIRNKINDDVYVGSTTISLAKRMAKHRWSCKNQPHRKLYEHMGELGIDNFYIELIEDCPCDNKEHLNKKEGEWIRQMGTLNSIIAGRSQKEWREDHAEHRKEQQAQYYIANAEKYERTLNNGWRETKKGKKSMTNYIIIKKRYLLNYQMVVRY